MASPIVECVPNFSEGRDKGIIDAIARSISGIAGVSLLDVDPGADTNRTVYTFIGHPDAVASAALAAAQVAFDLIDMTKHSGAHPRMGALDVCPFVPVSGIEMADCVALSKRVGEALASQLGVPVYLYEAAATRPERKSLADLRSGEYEALPGKLALPEWAPDFGASIFVPRWGATVVGAREFLIAYNVNLNTRDKRLANEIALNLREAGRAAKDSAGNPIKDAEGRAVKIPGRLKEVRAIGWYIESYRCAQVSINLLDYKKTPLHLVFETAKEEAEKLGLLVTGSEIVGLVPRDPIVAAGKRFLAKMGKSEGACEADLVETAIKSMGLSSVAPFEPSKKIVEYAGRSPAPLASMSLSAFADELSSESPAPGGGSVAALAGSLGAALAAMVANLTVGKKGREAAWAELSALAVEAQEIKSALVAAVDEDTAAFNRIMDAMKLPRGNGDQKALREKALQEAYIAASQVPLETAAASVEALRICAAVAELGIPASASDAGVGALMARAGLEGALLNVRINLGQVKDETILSAMRARAVELQEEGRRLEALALKRVGSAIEANE
jgi:glutamate formiminotransferase / formiminotetrahydrofolate cyclodeaminase